MIGLPEVDVIIPVGGTTRYLHDAIASAQSQSCVETNVILVDACGAPNSPPIDIPDGVTLVESPSRLLAGGARNLGLSIAEASLVSFLDADDLWPTSRTSDLAEMLNGSQRHIAAGKLEILREPGRSNGLVGPLEGSTALLAGGVLLSRTLATAIGDFDPDLRAGEFVEWLARAKSKGVELLTSPATSLIRRLHNESSTARGAENRADYLKVVKAWMNNND